MCPIFISFKSRIGAGGWRHAEAILYSKKLRFCIEALIPKDVKYPISNILCNKMADKAIELVAERWPLIATAILASTIALFVPTLKRKAALWHLPIVGKEKWNYETRRIEFLLRAEKVYEEGYRKVLHIPVT